jgi:hypothetical protein
MKLLKRKALLLVFLLLPLSAKASPVGVTHMLPSPYTVEAGTLLYGTSLTYGITDFLQVGTNAYQLLNDVPNANAKLSFLDTENWAAAATFEWAELDLENVRGERVATVTQYGPGVVVSTSITDVLSWTNGVKVIRRTVEGSEANAIKSGINQGTTYQSEIGWLYQDAPKKGNRGGARALATGISYDTTYKLFGVGISHHWPGFQLGVHYYPGADEKKWIPIIVGGGSISI